MWARWHTILPKNEMMINSKVQSVEVYAVIYYYYYYYYLLVLFSVNYH